MAIDYRGLAGRPSLRRALGGLDRRQEEEFAAVTADVDPRRFGSLYKQRAAEFLDQERELAAQRAPGVRLARQQRMASAITDRNFRGADVGGVDFEDEDYRSSLRRYGNRY